MRIAGVWVPGPNAQYRAVDPLKCMEGRGHDIVWPSDPAANPDIRQLAACDVVHLYRRADDEIRPIVGQLVRAGIPLTYDNDDDFTSTPKQSPGYKKTGAYRGQRYFAATVRVAKMAHAASTTSAVLADKYRRAGVERIEVIPNALSPDVRRPRNRHDGLVIGWIAAMEHLADLSHIELVEALVRLTQKHANMRVECIGVDLRLPQRYRHDASVPFVDLPRRIAGFDIGIAPLANIPWNRARSDIKLKEYAASGIPWLASPVGPYEHLGEAQGGRLVPDDGWFAALDRLLTHTRERRRLARKAKHWAKTQTIDAVADRWERLFSDAAASKAVSA